MEIKESAVKLLEKKYGIPRNLVISLLENYDEHTTEKACKMINKGANPTRVIANLEKKRIMK